MADTGTFEIAFVLAKICLGFETLEHYNDAVTQVLMDAALSDNLFGQPAFPLQPRSR